MSGGSLLLQHLARDDADFGQKRKHQRQLKDNTKSQNEESHKAKVTIRSHQFSKATGRESDKPLDWIAQDDIAQRYTNRKEHDTDEDEGHRILLLVLI